ncbi:MAG: Holliday junction branch migration protein RuvA [Lentisphaerae bacterium]|nr:Holliday junction branch migration protein RuvA [Lentisphaerota bacterium]
MIAFLEGLLHEKSPTRVVVETHGVGYEALIPLSSFDRLPAERELCRLLIHEHIREDQHTLFGFVTAAEREMFQRLMDVNGIGPKLALSALSSLSIRELKAAIVQGDVRRLGTIAGIGKKMAERIVVELRDKISAGDAAEAVAARAPLSPADVKTRDAVMALIALGYKQAEAQKAIAEARRSGGADSSVEDLVRLALKR